MFSKCPSKRLQASSEAISSPRIGSETVSPTTRLIVNITAITLALWVPIIWLVVLSGGISTPDPDALNGPNSDLPGETVSEPIRQEEMASEDA